MKIRNFFDLIGDARDIVDLFEGVESVEQMVSRLERLKRHEAEEFLINIHSLKMSVNNALDDTLEMGGRLDEGEEESDDFDEEDLEGLGGDEEGDAKPPGEKPKEEPKVETKT